MNDKKVKKVRLDRYLKDRDGLSRVQVVDQLNSGLIRLNGQVAKKPSQLVGAKDRVAAKKSRFVSRGGEKLAQANKLLKINFKNKVVVDIGASVGGFSDYSLQAGARLVIAVENGRQPLSPKILANPRVIFRPQTDARQLVWDKTWPDPEIVLVDLSFISLRLVLGPLSLVGQKETVWLVLFKPQFEAQKPDQIHLGRPKNSRQQKEIVQAGEDWFKKNNWQIVAKTDSPLKGRYGNQERFYQLAKRSATW